MLDFITNNVMVSDVIHDFNRGDTGMAIFGALIILLIAGVILAVGLGILYGIFCLLFSRNKYSTLKTVKAEVVMRTLVPEHGGMHASPIVGGNGGVAISSDHESEKDIVVLRSKETGRIKLDHEELMYAVKEGETVDLTYKEKYTYWVWDSSKLSFSEYLALEVKTKDNTVINVEGA